MCPAVPTFGGIDRKERRRKLQQHHRERKREREREGGVRIGRGERV